MTQDTDAYCNSCHGSRHHEMLYKTSGPWEDYVEELDETLRGEDTYELLKCRGCDHITMRHTYTISSDMHSVPQTHVNYYPPATYRREPEWLESLDDTSDTQRIAIWGLLREVYRALQSGSTRLATMGVRAIIESVMIDKIGDHGTFRENLSTLEREGFISRVQREIIDPVVEAGHASMHRGYQPLESQVLSLLDIVENLVETLYVNVEKSKALRPRIPVREPKREA